MWDKNRELKLVTTGARRVYLVSEVNFTTEVFSENLLPVGMKTKNKKQIAMNNPVYLD